MKLFVDVSNDDIDNGVPMDACECPVARAIRRIYKVKKENVAVNEDHIEIEGETYNMPRSVKRFVKKFDKLHENGVMFNFSEFRFELKQIS